MTKTVALVGALDTKAEDYLFLKEEIEKRGCATLTINVGVLGAPGFAPDVSAAEVAQAGGASLDDLVAERDRGRALDVMTQGAAVMARQLYDAGRFQGIIAMGGGGGTALGTNAMRALPIGVPKLMVSTIASGDTAAYVGTSDIVMMPSIVDVAGVNRISRVIYTNAAAAICGMVASGQVTESPGADKPLVAISQFGNTTRAVTHARGLLEQAGYEVLVFHATGTGGRMMEKLVSEGYFAGVLDMTTTEWADELCGGVLSAGPTRLEAAAQAGVPQVVTPACLDMCNFWAPETIPDRYRGRLFYHWNPNVTLMRTSSEENAQLGEIFADKLNQAQGPVLVLVPMGGFSEVDIPGGPFWLPEADQAFVDALRRNLRPEIPVEIMDVDVNNPAFSTRAVEALLALLSTH
jgi:uncharacterized protein (UPF0261 family)